MTTKQSGSDSNTKRINRYLVRKKIMNTVALTFRYIILICIGFLIIKPIYTTLLQAITEQTSLGLNNSTWIPPETSAQSFVEANIILDYSKALPFSILNTLLLALLQTLSAALAAYTFARLKFKGSNLLFGLVIFTIIVPAQSIMLAQYTCFRNFDIFGIFKAVRGESINLIGSTVAMYLLSFSGVGIKGGLYIYILRQSYRQLPVSIEEAAYVDGAGFLKTFFLIVVPGVSTTLLTVSVLSFVWNYADTYFISLLMGNAIGKKQLSVRLVNIEQNMRWAIQEIEADVPSKYVVNFESPIIQKGVACACAILVIAPLIILYLFVQKKFVQGVERSGLGGD